jgi:hypothetical protein
MRLRAHMRAWQEIVAVSLVPGSLLPTLHLQVLRAICLFIRMNLSFDAHNEQRREPLAGSLR